MDSSQHDNFFEYAQNFYTLKKFDPIAYVPYPQREQFDIFIEDIIPYCEFLNQIPKDDWEENFVLILKWSKWFYAPPVFQKGHEKNRPSIPRKKHIEILKATQTLLKEFIPKEINRTTNNQDTVFIDYEGIAPTDLFFIKDLHKKLEEAVLDIQKKDFKIFPEEYYEGSKKSEKQNLEKLLREIAQKYNISPYANDIRTLLENI